MENFTPTDSQTHWMLRPVCWTSQSSFKLGEMKSLSFAPLLARPHALSLVSHPLRGRPTSDPDPSPSLWVLIICLSVKHQKPSSPPLSPAVSLASGTQRDSGKGSRHWKGGGDRDRGGRDLQKMVCAATRRNDKRQETCSNAQCRVRASPSYNPYSSPWPLTRAWPIKPWEPNRIYTNKQIKSKVLMF